VLAATFLADRDSERLRTSTSGFVWSPPTSALTATSSLGERETSISTSPGTTFSDDLPLTTDPREPDTSSSSSTTSPPTSGPVTATALLPDEDRDSVVVRVLNGGGDAGADEFVTGVLEIEGFAPDAPGQAVEPVDRTSVLYRPGREAEAMTVNLVIEADRDRVRCDTADPNWIAYGGLVDVLVIVGPPT
jgi:hypothetical protein